MDLVSDDFTYGMCRRREIYKFDSHCINSIFVSSFSHPQVQSNTLPHSNSTTRPTSNQTNNTFTMSGNTNSKSSGQMGKDDSARISSANVSLQSLSSSTINCFLTTPQAKSGGDMSLSGFAARAQSAADTNANNNAASGNTGSGGQGGNAQGGSNKK
jgi:hypothetical protein